MKNSKTNTNGLQYLPFEDNIAQLDAKIAELQLQSEKDGAENGAAIRRLQREQTAELKKLYSNLTPWQVVQRTTPPLSWKSLLVLPSEGCGLPSTSRGGL